VTLHSGAVSTAAVDYLQRSEVVPQLDALPSAITPLAARRLARVTGLGELARPGAVAWSPAAGEWPTLSFLVGMAGALTPIAYLLQGDERGVSIRIGTWTSPDGDTVGLDERQRALLTTLDGSYPVVDLGAAGVATGRLPRGALALGVPSPRPQDSRDGATPVDRLLRSMAGRTWVALLMARPVDSSTLATDRNGVLNELREVAANVQSGGTKSPLAEYYTGLLERRLHALADARSRGGWQTAVYLLGATDDDLLALTSSWRAVFSGPDSLPEPVHTMPHSSVAALAAGWAMPLEPEQAGPTTYRHPFAAQTLLSSTQLASYIHLPALETPGFRVRLVPRFDTEPPVEEGPDSLVLGSILNQRRQSGPDYRVRRDSLTRHTFVSGATGSGKTNTIFSLLTEADAAGVPFLVIEPAKAEYRRPPRRISGCILRLRVHPEMRCLAMITEVTRSDRRR
jgi:hypothetical protein